MRPEGRGNSSLLLLMGNTPSVTSAGLFGNHIGLLILHYLENKHLKDTRSF